MNIKGGEKLAIDLFDIRVRTVKLRLTNNDIIREINKRGIKCSQSEYSLAIHGALNTPKALDIINAADEILKEKETEEKKLKNG